MFQVTSQRNDESIQKPDFSLLTRKVKKGENQCLLCLCVEVHPQFSLGHFCEIVNATRVEFWSLFFFLTTVSWAPRTLGGMYTCIHTCEGEYIHTYQQRTLNMKCTQYMLLNTFEQASALASSL